jgi:excisionase family DNA binding protein
LTQEATLAGLPAQRLIDAKAVGDMLGCSQRTVFRLADEGRMPWGLKVGALRRWNGSEVETWIAGGCKAVRSAGRGVR